MELLSRYICKFIMSACYALYLKYDKYLLGMSVGQRNVKG